MNHPEAFTQITLTKHQAASIRACAGLAAPERDVTELREALRDVTDQLEGVLETFGYPNCDHDVNVCCCEDKRRIERARAVLARFPNL